MVALASGAVWALLEGPRAVLRGLIWLAKTAFVFAVIGLVAGFARMIVISSGHATAPPAPPVPVIRRTWQQEVLWFVKSVSVVVFWGLFALFVVFVLRVMWLVAAPWLHLH